jgi:hypothetical protein
VGIHSITATYSGDANNAGGTSAAFSLTINKVSTTVGLTSSTNPSLASQTVTLSIQVTPTAATGAVQILDGGTAIGTVTLVNGTGSLTISNLSSGAHSLTAGYGGDAYYDVSTSPALAQQVNAIATTITLTASQNPGILNAQTTFTATITPSTTYGSQPAGTVRLLNGTTSVGFLNLTNGSAQFQVTFGTLGTRSMTAVYSGDGNFQGATSTAIAEAVKVSTTIVLSGGPNPSVTGSTVNFAANVQQSGASGTIELDDVTTGTPVPLGSGATSPTAATTFSISNLSPGTHIIVANYLGDADHMSSTSASMVMVVKTATTTAISANPTLAVPGQAIQFTATITPSAGTGTVQFFDAGTSIGTATVNNGTAVLSISTLSPGLHNVHAVYSGDSNYSGSGSSSTGILVKASTSVALASSLNPSVSGQSVTFTATVSPSVASGTVQFLDGATVLGTALVSGGSASFSTPALAAGAHTISASYSGDGNYASSSASLAQTVKATTTTALSASSTTPTFGQSVTLTASVNPASAAGAVQFLDGATVLGTAALSGGSAAISTSSLAVGSHSITAVYGGDAGDTGSSSSAIAVTVRKMATATALASSLNPAVSGQSVTFTATVSPASATGSVQFKDGGTILGTVTLAGGSAAFSTSSLAIGSHSITAVYGGDGNGNGSTSAALTETVNAPPPGDPSNLTATASNSSTINLTWTASPTSGVTYNVYSSANAIFTPGPSNRIANGQSHTNYSNSGLPASTTRYYVVTAQKANVESAASNQASATTKPH